MRRDALISLPLFIRSHTTLLSFPLGLSLLPFDSISPSSPLSVAFRNARDEHSSQSSTVHWAHVAARIFLEQTRGLFTLPLPFSNSLPQISSYLLLSSPSLLSSILSSTIFLAPLFPCLPFPYPASSAFSLLSLLAECELSLLVNAKHCIYYLRQVFRRWHQNSWFQPIGCCLLEQYKRPEIVSQSKHGARTGTQESNTRKV